VTGRSTPSEQSDAIVVDEARNPRSRAPAATSRFELPQRRAAEITKDRQTAGQKPVNLSKANDQIE
jgi:hypothetical protein